MRVSQLSDIHEDGPVAVVVLWLTNDFLPASVYVFPCLCFNWTQRQPGWTINSNK